MTPPTPSAPDAKAFLFLAGTLVVALQGDLDSVAVTTVRLTATLKDHSTQWAHVCCNSRRTAEAYFAALGVPEAAVWWRCFHPAPAPAGCC